LLACLLATQLSRTAKHSAVKDVNLLGIFVLSRSSIVISFLFVAKVNFLFKNQKVYSGKYWLPPPCFRELFERCGTPLLYL
ncbi:MAG TPA: hypothetical protein H9984_04440, partial [Candidatus Parabacteroides faecavium]|nr:hypothetical protein [Candidatus Parabacteroides faecavium]